MTPFGLQIRLPTTFLPSSHPVSLPPCLSLLSLPFSPWLCIIWFVFQDAQDTGGFCLQVEAACAARGLLSKAFESKLALSVQGEAFLVPDLRSSP